MIIKGHIQNEVELLLENKQQAHENHENHEELRNHIEILVHVAKMENIVK
jgi:hypothetical protein